ncbi:MAG: substrate-binding domain-containing protein [Gemmatimonadota bacterium]
MKRGAHVLAASWLAASRLPAALLAAVLLAAGCARGDSEAVLLATTTSVEDSGLLAHLLEAFRQEVPGAAIRPLAVGSGEALELGRRGDADLLIVHHPSEEEAFVAGGYGEARVPIMFNDFVVVGPPADPAGVASSNAASEALRRIAGSGELFLSRGDNSGTHYRELEVWRAADVVPEGRWYQDAGQGMGPVLQMASERGAYVLTDRSTFYAMEPHLELAVLFEGDPRLRNVYSVIIVHGSLREAQARALQDWLTSPDGRRAIDGYLDDYGRPLFHSMTPGDEALEAWPGRSAAMRTRGASGAPGSRASEVPRRPTLRARLLCRSVPPAHADARCG